MDLTKSKAKKKFLHGKPGELNWRYCLFVLTLIIIGGVILGIGIQAISHTDFDKARYVHEPAKLVDRNKSSGYCD